MVKWFTLKSPREASPGESAVEEKVLILLLLFTLFIRLLSALMIETGGDGVTLWFHVKQLYLGLPYEVTHQSVRFGLILPVYLVMQIFGTHPAVYYIIPFAASLLLTALLYRIGIMVANRTVALFACILLNIFPWTVQAVLQLLPGFITATYIIASFYLLLRFREEGGESTWRLVLSGFLFFMAYGAKETSLFFLPGFFITLWLMTRRFRDLVIFGSVPLVLFIGETLFYYLKYNLPYGRLSVVTKTHFEGPMTRVFPLKSFWSLLGRFTKMALSWKAVFYAYFIAAFWCFATSMKKEIRLIAIMTFSFVFFQTFSVKSLSPVIPTQPFNDRHMDLALPGVMIMITWFFSDVTRRIRERFSRISLSAGEGKWPMLFPVSVISFFVLFSVAAYVMALSYFPGFERGNFFTSHPFALVHRYHDMLNRAYAAGEPIVIRKSEPLRFRRKVDEVQKIMARGRPEAEACREAGVDPKEYRDSLMRVTDGDYKALNVFIYAFWDGAGALAADPSAYPVIDRVTLSGKPFGILMDKKFRSPGYVARIFSRGESTVLELSVKPFTVHKLTAEEFLKKPSPVYD